MAKLILGTLDPELVKKFAVDREFIPIEKARGGMKGELDLNQLCTLDDLLVQN